MFDYFTRKRSHFGDDSLITSFEDWLLSLDGETIKYWLAILSCILSLIAVIFATIWADGSSTKEGYLGGLDYEKHIFNYHPVLMITGMIFFATISLLSYKVAPYSNSTIRMLHVLLHLSAIICFSVGVHYARLAATPSFNEEGTYKANFVTLHSWIGIIAISIYLFNFFGGLLVFLLKVGSQTFQTVYMMSHRTVGIISLMMSTCAALSGIQLKSNCSRSVSEEDTNPAIHYYDLPAGCRVSNGMGLCVLFSTFLAIYVLMPQSSAVQGDINQIKYAPDHVAEAARIEIGERSKPGMPPMPPSAHADTDLLAR